MEKPKSQVQQLVDYIKKNLSKGYTLDSLKYSLIAQGYSRISINEAIEIAHREMAKEVPPIKEKPLIIHRIFEEEPIEKKGFWKKLLGRS
jgi:hypothetical protein